VRFNVVAQGLREPYSLQYADDYFGNGRMDNFYHNGMKFTTADRDNDELVDGNCAENWSGGWWYNACYFACLTCEEDDCGWWSLNEAFVDNSRMMIKPQ